MKLYKIILAMFVTIISNTLFANDSAIYNKKWFLANNNDVFIEISPNNSISGKLPCNYLLGNITINKKNKTISFKIGRTLMACDENIMSEEEEIIQKLEQVKYFESSYSNFILKDSKHKEILQLNIEKIVRLYLD